MTSFAFIVGIIVLFLVLMIFETDDVSAKLRSRQTSLWTWLVSGNWPAKIGSILLIIGIGALMRYALVNIDVPGQVKLSVGVLITAFCGYWSYLLREQPRHRALHLALAGATCGVAYLTAYSAYGFFGYLDNITGITLLVIVAGVTGAFAVASNALSIAVLAMIGAYIAPAFAVDADPGPLVVYGYYLAISILSLLMILSKGWRPLIHLSFLFTLGGGIFFGWTGQYYQVEYYSIMQPILLVLVALHLAMPILERRATQGIWGRRFDQGYFIVLPITAAILTYVISPQIRPELSIGLLSLGFIWTITAALQARRKGESIKYAIVAFLFYTAAALAVLEDVSFSLFGIFCMTVILTAAVRLNFPKGVSSASSFLLILFIGLWFIESGFSKVTGQAFYNTWFWEHVVAALLVCWSAYLNRQRSEIYKAVFYFIAGAIMLHAVLIEIFRLQIVYVAEIVHVLILTGLLFTFTGAIKASTRSLLFLTLAIILFVNSWMVAIDVIYPVPVAFALLDILVLGIIAYLFSRESYKDENLAIIAILSIPIFALPWTMRLSELLEHETIYFVLSGVMAATLVSVIFAHFIKWTENRWEDGILPRLFLVAALLLVWPVIFHIERGLWPVIFELTGLTMIIFIAASNKSDELAEKIGVITIILSALILQAMLLRIYGPEGIMTIADISQIRYPTVVSFIWVFLGGAIAWWGGRIASRIWWSAGSGLMVVAAAKLVFIDFGSLGEFGNIVGIIAAGMVFLVIAWLVPIPPKKPTPAPKPSRVEPDDKSGSDIKVQKLSEKSSAAINLKPVNAGEQTKADTISEQKTTSGGVSGVQKIESTPPVKSGIILPIVIFAGFFIFMFWLIMDLTSPPPPHTKPYRKADVPVQEENVENQKKADINKTPAKSVQDDKQYPTTEDRVITKDVVSEGKKEEIKIVDVCTQFRESLPSDYILYAGGEYKGRELNFQIDKSGHEATQFEVYVNDPGKNVVLALGAYEPSVWNIKWTDKTKIAGVFVSGYYKQVVIGINDDVPVLNSTHADNSTCGYFYFNPDEPHKTDNMLKEIFNQSAQTYYVASGGKINMGKSTGTGQSWYQDQVISIQSFREKDTPLAGKEGLEQLIKEGKLRPATTADMQKWQQINSSSSSHLSVTTIDGNTYKASDIEFHRIRALGSYVVLESMRYPAGLYGAHSVTFIIPEGVPRPGGNPGHSTILDMNHGSCSGTLCSK